MYPSIALMINIKEYILVNNFARQLTFYSNKLLLIYSFFKQIRYSAGKNLLNDMECQMKVICEIYQDGSNELGEIGKRARHSLDFVDAVQYLNLPDEFLNLADEYAVRIAL